MGGNLPRILSYTPTRRSCPHSRAIPAGFVWELLPWGNVTRGRNALVPKSALMVPLRTFGIRGVGVYRQRNIP